MNGRTGNLHFCIRRGWIILTAGLLSTLSSPSSAQQIHQTNLQLPIAADGSDCAASAHEAYFLPYDADRWPQKYLEWLWKDPVNLVTSPIYWRGEEWKTFGIEAGVTGALFPVDAPTRDFVQDNRTSSLDSTLNTVRDVTGGGSYYFAASRALFGSGLVVRNEKLADSGFLALESFPTPAAWLCSTAW